MHVTLAAPAIVAVVGVLVYAFSSNAKQLGAIAFGCGLLALLLNVR
jgi:hypothetical protein